ncbi:hypothetical protein ACFU6I_28140 [Streptomyces sp. NPDC057486]|uniref:hypothetical protein n=1 Tax=Streptomyces sp. NPDC057486 TaxID=3346145 RepID=UPI0036C40E95
MEHENDGYTVFPGVTAAAVRRCHSFFGLPGRTLHPGLADCHCRGCSLDDVTLARDVLDDVLALLPPRPQAELRRLVARNDRKPFRRTLLDPPAPGHPWRREAWWRMRSYDGVIGSPAVRIAGPHHGGPRGATPGGPPGRG